MNMSLSAFLRSLRIRPPIRPLWASTAGRQSTGPSFGCQSVRLAIACILLVSYPGPIHSAVDSSHSDDAVALIEASRALKDSLFRSGDDSPLRPEDIAGFSGLRYFPADPEWRITGEFQRYGRTRQVPLPDTGGSTIAVERYGRFVFQWNGKPFWLEVFRSLQGGSLSVYFTDETNGELTYGAGRYAVVSRSDSGSYLIDFNGAYNPYCAYNEDYICPLPPPQNHLPFKVSAGELVHGPNLAH